MAGKRNRALDGLGEPGYAELAFQAIERAFNPLWLEAEGPHPIKKLWNRPDRLATVELFVFGSALEKLQRTQPEWLKMALKKVKTNKPYIGFITEIITCAQLQAVKGKIEPAGNNQKGYDLATTYDHGAKHFISIKNHDVSEAQKEFSQHSKHVRNLWRQKLRLENENLALRVIGNEPISIDDFEDVKRYIQKDIDLYQRKSVPVNSNVRVIVVPLYRSEGTLSKSHTSDMFMVVAPGPGSEQLRFRRSIIAAAANMKKNIEADEKACNVIFMRVHVNADLDYLAEVAQEILNEGMSGVDCILFYQPSYVRDPENRSLISNTFKPAVSMRFIQSLDGRPGYDIRPALGSVSLEASKLVVQMDGVRSNELQPNMYLFQEGDIYVVSDKPDEGYMSAPAMGIREHAILKFQGQEMTVSGKIYPLSDELLIV